EILGMSLPPHSYDGESLLRRQLKSLSNKSEEGVGASANARLPEADQTRLSELLAQNREGMLTPEKTEELEALLDKVEQISMEKVAAKWLLAHWDARSK